MSGTCYKEKLFNAIKNGDCELVNWMLKKSPPLLLETDEHGNRIHLQAAYFGQKGVMCDLLYEFYLPLESRNKYGGNIMFSAVGGGNMEIIEYLMEEENLSLNVKAKNGATLLLEAAFNGQIEVMKFLLNHNASLKEETRKGTNALLMAVFGGHLEAVKWLIEEQHCDIHFENKLNNTALGEAVLYNHLDIVQYLVGCNSNLNSGVNPPIMVAANHGNVDIIHELIVNGATYDLDTIIGTLTKKDENLANDLLLRLQPSKAKSAKSVK